MNADLTLLLLTHNRPTFLKRSLAYYAGLPFRLLVLDSSDNSSAVLLIDHPSVEYIHCPEFGFLGISDKIKMGVSQVRTPYMALVADDDFMFHSALDESVAFLRENPDYGLCHGYSVMYLPEAKKIHYFLRDRKVKEDFSSDSVAERLLGFMANYIPPAYAVTRTDLIKSWYEKQLSDYGFEFQEFGHTFHLIVNAKARILCRPYIVRELNYPASDHGTDLLSALHWASGERGEEKRRFIEFLSAHLVEAGYPVSGANRLVHESFRQLSDCLSSQRSLTLKEIFYSDWEVFADVPRWNFQPEQFVEMPFYNKAFFGGLEIIDLLVRTLPAGKLQLKQLEPILASRQEILAEFESVPQATALEQVKVRLEQAFQSNPFDWEIAKLLVAVKSAEGGQESIDRYSRWAEKLESATAVSQAYERLERAELADSPEPLVLSSRDEVASWLAARLPTSVQSRLIAEFLQQQGGGPCFVVFVLDLEGDATKLTETINSLGGDKQLYATLKIVALTLADVPKTSSTDKLHFVRVSVDNYVSTINTIVREGAFDWVMMVEAGDEFTAGGLMIAALELIASPGCRAIYGDEMLNLAGGSLGPMFRPGFNLDLLLSLPVSMARHWLFRRDAFVESGGFDQRYGSAMELDLILRLVESGGMQDLGHVSEPLLITHPPALQDNPDERASIARHLAVRGYPQAHVGSDLPGCYHIDYGHAQQPLVSIIIPTKDQLPILQRCVESLLEKTRYPHYEVLIVDNNSETPEACEWLAGVEALADEKVRVLRYPHPFNFSAINNMAARAARGEYLVLLNNDTAIIREDWLDELLNHAQRPEVGIVGAKLLYPDGRIQHAGVVLGLRGPADHPFIGEVMDAPGYMQRLQVDQNYSAVTAACLMIRKSLYDEMGGMDEQAFKVSYNDVDLCLKVGAAGYLNVWTPHAMLLHEGSVSQKKVDPASAAAKRKRFIAEQDAMYAKWLPTLASDPAYNRNLSLNAKGFELEPDNGLTWRPLSWRPLPVVLAHPADPWGCGNYRIIKPFEALRDAALVDGMLSEGLLQVVDLQRYDPDVIVLQRQIGDERLEAMRRIKQFSRAFKVYELDDYLPNLPIKSVHRDQMPKDILKSLRRGLSYVDRFVVSTVPLADALSGFHPDIRVIENRLPVDWWQGLSSRRRRGQKPRVGWAGGIGHTGDLELIADVIRELASEVEWVFFGMCPEKIRPYVHEMHAGVDIEGYSAALAALDLDLALAPVEQNLFNDCKSNLRLLEYGACGFPVICSDVLCYRGDLAVTLVKNRFKDWVDAIRMHINDLEATARMGDELRAQVMDKWMLQAGNVDAWREAWLPD